MLSPSFLSRKIFSITTMELSTSIPIPSVRPDMDLIFRVIPEKYISTMANIMEIGIAQAIIIVGLISLRKIIRIIMASEAPRRIF